MVAAGSDPMRTPPGMPAAKAEAAGKSGRSGAERAAAGRAAAFRGTVFERTAFVGAALAADGGTAALGFGTSTTCNSTGQTVPAFGSTHQ